MRLPVKYLFAAAVVAGLATPAVAQVAETPKPAAPKPVASAAPAAAKPTEAELAAARADFAAAKTAYDASNYALSFQKFQPLANGGFPDAQYFLALHYHFGRGVKASLPDAAGWYEKAAKQGMPEAAYAFGSMLLNGEGVAQNKLEAAKWFKLNYRLTGSGAAATQLAALYEANIGGTPSEAADMHYDAARKIDAKSALAALEALSAKGVARAGAYAGLILIEGAKDLTKDPARGVKLLEAAAAKDDVVALNGLGQVWQAAMTGTQDHAKAAEYFRRASDLGSMVSTREYGQALCTGIGVPKDKVKGRALVEKARNAGDKTAYQWLLQPAFCR